MPSEGFCGLVGGDPPLPLLVGCLRRELGWGVGRCGGGGLRVSGGV